MLDEKMKHQSGRECDSRSVKEVSKEIKNTDLFSKDNTNKEKEKYKYNTTKKRNNNDDDPSQSLNNPSQTEKETESNKQQPAVTLGLMTQIEVSHDSSVISSRIFSVNTRSKVHTPTEYVELFTGLLFELR